MHRFLVLDKAGCFEGIVIFKASKGILFNINILVNNICFLYLFLLINIACTYEWIILFSNVLK